MVSVLRLKDQVQEMRREMLEQMVGGMSASFNIPPWTSYGHNSGPTRHAGSAKTNTMMMDRLVAWKATMGSMSGRDGIPHRFRGRGREVRESSGKEAGRDQIAAGGELGNNREGLADATS